MPISNLKDTLGLKTDLPLILFPVRLETRFTANELLVRVYPDTVHGDSFEPELTEVEINWGKNFWMQTWLGAKTEAGEHSAWAQLAEHFGVARAAWIAQVMTPTNPNDQREPVDGTLPIEPKFPNPATHAKAWTRAAYTQILPEKWMVLVYENESSNPLIFEGNPITLPLDISISPEKGLNAKTLKNDPDIGWLVNFSKAKEKGMGLSIPNPPKNIKRLVVLGVNTALSGEKGRQKLEKLIQAHHHTQGISFLRQGTPSNNTDDAPSGYNTLDPGFENSFRVERKATTTLIKDSNREVSAKALGVDDKIFTHVREANTVEQLDAQTMNAVLWQATWGYFLEQMMAGPDAPSEQSLRQARSHFERYVRARGPLPALRIGAQPYGVLPVISLKHWQSKPGDAPVDLPLAAFLQKVREVWRNSLAQVPNVPGGLGITNGLSSVLNYAPVSVNYHRRPAQRVALRSPSPSPKASESGNQTAKDKLKDFGLSWIPRHIRMVYGDILQEPSWSGLLVGSNLLKNPNFEGIKGHQSIPLENKGVGIVSAADQWTLWNNVEGITTTELISSSSPYGGSKTMIHVTTTGAANGLVQTFLPINAGPTKIIASAWVFVHRGHVGIGTGNGGNTHLDVISKTTGQWEYLEAMNGVSPANEFIIYSMSEAGAEFDVAAASVIETPQFYCEWLITGNHHILWQRKLNAASDSLFNWLLREACLREYLSAACRIVKLTNPDENFIELEFENGGVSALSDLLDRPVSGSNPIKIGNYLDTLKKQLKSNEFNLQKIPEAKNFQQELSDFAAFYKSLDYLANQPVDILEGLLKETLDLCSHRYDAWVTSLATKRLEVLRKQYPQGAYLGGYGWVEDLRSDSTPNKNHGFIHAPSLAHATTAALLRSGYISHDEHDRETFAVNLSSQRVRTALWLLDGVRQGQSLGALLGYRFERGLHENHLKDVGISLDHYIPFFRQIAPLTVDALASMTKEVISAQSATQVVDGLALLRNWQSRGRVIPWEKYDSPTIPVPPDNHKKACQEELERLEDAVDAISDLVIAESVHHVAQGNPVRAGATLSAIAEGEAPPPELDVIRTPRSGIGITHRIAVVFDGLPKGPVWGPQTARARAEPFLNAWAAQLFGPLAAKSVCQVEYVNLDPADKNKTIVLGQKAITLDQLGLAPIDLLYLPESEGDAQRSELEQRVIYLAQRSLPAGVSSAAEIKLTFNRDPSDDVMGFAEVLEVARAARRMITSARALNPRDLAQPGQSIPAEAENDPVLPGESAGAPLALSERAEAAIKAFEKVCNSLMADLPKDDTAPINSEVIRKKLMNLSEFGLPGAVPLAPMDDTVEVQNVLRSQAQSIVNEASKRLDRLDTLTQDYEKLKRDERIPIVIRDYHIARLHEVFGQEFLVLPRFNPASAANLRTTFAASKELQDNDPLASVTWFQRIARVREGAARLDAALMYAEAIGGSKLHFSVGQLPYDPKKDPKERWVALSGDIPGSRLSLVVHAPSHLNLTNPVAGLLIDEWVEVVPSKEEITGLTFHYNAPQSRAPQAILLAIAPNDNKEWSLEMLTDTLLETLELAKLRMVDLTCLLDTKRDSAKSDLDTSCGVNSDALSDAGQFLPALYFPQSHVPEWKEKTS